MLFLNLNFLKDFGAKLYGVRLAFRRIMDQPQTMQWLIQSGRIIMADLMRHDKRDPAEFFKVNFANFE